MVNDGSSSENSQKITPPKLVRINGIPDSAKKSAWQNGEWVTPDSPTQPVAAVNPKADPQKAYDPTFQDTWPMSLMDLAGEINKQEERAGKLHDPENEDTRPVPVVKPPEQRVVPSGDITNPSGK